MDKLILHPTETSQWHALINEAQAMRAVEVGEEMESYLVFLLMRFTQQPELASSVVAVDFLESHHSQGAGQRELLRDVGDKCLLFSGLFPGNAERRRVTLNYFVNIGQSAYGNLSQVTHVSAADLFAALANEFVTLMDVLHATRELSAHENSPAQRSTLDLWHDCSDEKVDEMMARYSRVTTNVLKKEKH